jgi:RHS repeat-associated protein
MQRSGRDFYFHRDDVGSVRKVTDATGAVVEGYDYDDFGSPTYFNGLGLEVPASQIGNPHLFQGREFDPETGLYYFRNRHYDPMAGRFIQRDLREDERNLGNAFAFAGHSPYTLRDPLGLEGEDGQPARNPVDIARDTIERGGWKWIGLLMQGQGDSDWQLYQRGAKRLDEVRSSNCFGFIQYILHRSKVPVKARPKLVVTETRGTATYERTFNEAQQAMDALSEWVPDYAGHYEVAPEGHAPRAGDIVIWSNMADGDHPTTTVSQHIGMYTDDGTIVHCNSGKDAAEQWQSWLHTKYSIYDRRTVYRYVGDRSGGPMLSARTIAENCLQQLDRARGIAPITRNTVFSGPGGR